MEPLVDQTDVNGETVQSTIYRFLRCVPELCEVSKRTNNTTTAEPTIGNSSRKRKAESISRK
eukprot:scaffold374_cov282-Alexandrium_tamarense.AAC.6